METVIKKLLKTVKIGKSKLQILHFFKIKGGVLHLTNLDFTVIAPVEEPDGTYNIETFNKTGVLAAAKRDIDGSEFPSAPQLEEGEEMPLPFFDGPEDFLAHCSTDFATRKPLTGVCFKGNAVIATDGHTLLTQQINAKEVKETSIPIQQIQDIIKLKKLSKLQEVIKYKNNFASFQFADFIYIANVLEGPYPDYERVIPSNFEKETSLTKGETEQFINALKKIAPIADQKTSRNGGTNCQIAIVKGWAIHKSKDAGVKVKVKLPGDYWPRPMGFNAKLLLRCLEDQHGACIIKGGSCLGATMIVSGNRRTIIMPLRLLDEECDLMTPLFNIEEYISL